VQFLGRNLLFIPLPSILAKVPEGTSMPILHPLHSHSAHDYRFLVARWRAVAKASGLTMRPLATESGYPVFSLRSKRLSHSAGVYLSAGIHGDEPAGAEALITWAEQNQERLCEMPCLIFPCLNPWGLVNNSRRDAQGRDLNRVFHHDEAGAIHALKRMIKPHQFSLSLALHEDYDAQGLYLYEIERDKPFWGEALLEAARPFIPIEGRTSIEGRKAKAGLVRRKINLARFRKLGFPESVYLHIHHAQRSFTIETPSEFALEQRVAAHIAIIEECLRRIKA
jgi:hypothetical protein